MSPPNLKKCVAACAIALVGLGAVSAAHAARYVGSWDPKYGSPFEGTDPLVTTDDMWWSGSAVFDTGSCVANAGNGYLAACSGMTVSAATVDLRRGEGGTIVDTLEFDGAIALNKVQFANDGTTVLWVESGWWNPLEAGSGSAFNLSNYLFSVSFAQGGANLFHTGLNVYLEAHGGHGPDDRVLFWNGQGNGHIGDLCGPVNAPGDGDLCGFSNSLGAMTFVPVIPEPSTYALMFAGLGAVAFMARRRRRDAAV